jgi:CP family cyanate transporter-like MFS transporter
MSQTGGYLFAGLGPLLFGVLHTTTNGWSTSLGLLLVLVVPEVFLGLLAARPGFVRTVAARPEGQLEGLLELEGAKEGTEEGAEERAAAREAVSSASPASSASSASSAWAR